MRVTPPKYALRFLRWFCREDYIEEIEGDLIELFEKKHEVDPKKANRQFWWHVIRHFRPDFLRVFKTYSPINTGMYKNYLKVAWRHLWRQKMYSFINVSGLTIGMTCFILIAMYIQYELSYDAHHEKADQIYRVYQRLEGNTFRGTDLFAVSPEPLAAALMNELPEVGAATTLEIEQHIFGKKEHISVHSVLYTDSNWFDIFSLKMLEGDGKKAIEDPNSILLSQTLADKFFGENSPVGQTILLENEQLYTIKGVFEDVPANQQLIFESIVSIVNYSDYSASKGRWESNNYSTFLTLPKGLDYKAFEKKMKLFDKYTIPAFEAFPFTTSFRVQPIKEIHLYSSDINFGNGSKSDIRYIYLFAAIGFIILLLAGINYMNLATARSFRRSKEVGMRKVLGAQKKQLVTQLLGESFLLTLISLVLALGLVVVLLPSFNQLLDQPIVFTIGGSQKIFWQMLLAALVIGVFSGLYPAIFMSKVSPIAAFRGNILKNVKGSTLRNILVVLQFSAAIVLTVSAVVVYQQLQYIQNKQLGYNREQVLYMPFYHEKIGAKSHLIRSQLLSNPNIEKVAVSTNLPINTNNQGITEKWEGNNGEKKLPCYRYYVDSHFLDLYEIELLTGRNLSSNMPMDTAGSYLLNESAVEAIGWTSESAIGKSFRDGRVIGVVKDFHFQPMDLKIEPLFITSRNPVFHNQYGNFSAKIQVDNLENTLAYIQGIFKEVAPNIPFEYYFLDDSYNQLYQSEYRLGKAFNIFTALAIFIACIGLFGLISHNVALRAKEIGIRKVLGASILSIVQLLSKDFLRLVLVSVLLTTPIAWFAISRWLQGFAYRIELHWWVFLLAGGFAILIAFLTLGVQSFKAASANPIQALQNE